MHPDSAAPVSPRRRRPETVRRPVLAPPVPVIELSCTTPVDVHSVGVVRHLIRTALSDVELPSDAVDDIELAASEACTNVVLHAAGSGYYEVSVSVTAQRCQVEVAQRHPGSGRLRFRAMADPSAERGRGLALMSRLMDHVAIERDGDLAIVVLEKRLSPRA